MLDFIQVNQHELLTLSSSNDPLEIVKEILNTGTKYLILTMEELGARIFFLDNNEVNSIFKPAMKIENKNKIGCGDIFIFYLHCRFKNRINLVILRPGI